MRPPSPQEEDRRRVLRERKALTTERVRHVNRIKGLLFAQGVSGYEPMRRDRRARLEALRTGDGRELPCRLKAQVMRELDRLELLLDQIKAKPVRAEHHSADELLAQFLRLLSRQVAAYAGLAPTPWQSGKINHEQGVSKAGNPRLRATVQSSCR